MKGADVVPCYSRTADAYAESDMELYTGCLLFTYIYISDIELALSSRVAFLYIEEKWSHFK